ncbi:TonB-dependent siderophore receptor [Phenylobacterium aquaticum]|uniref:TonB-dependent receptor plug domain-containing protein n=1 Tax=Phenylobacterium aquaticum TaxID=1763816 RepID=UPI0026EF1C2D|nr:TonB-dependent receptor [Phenylobacterium aquaticum]
MKKNFLLASVAAGLSLAAALPAAAQSIDYGSLQELFNEPVTTSATGSPQRSTEVPVDMTIISQADIHRSGAKDLPTILARVAGVDVLNFAAGQSDVGIRGYNQARSPRLLVLVNGRQVYLDHFGYTDWSALPVQLSEIRQIEVVRGPNSAIFGFNAVSGVVNIITFNPKFDNVSRVEVYGGTGQSNGASLVETFHVGSKVSVRVSGGADQQDEWRNTSTTVTKANIFNPSAVHANLDAIVQLTPKAELRLEGSWSNLESTQVISTFAYAAHRVKTWSEKATLTADTDYGSIQGQVYQNQLDALTPGRRYLNTITVTSLQDLFKIGANNTIRVGLEHRDNQLDTASYVGGVVRYTVWAPSAMWNWAVNDKLALTAAVRYDQLKLERNGTFPAGFPLIQKNNSLWDRDIKETSVNLGAVYKLTPADSLRGTYARGVQAPTLLELGGLVIPPATPAPTGVLITGNPFLNPAIVTNYELAYDHDFAPLKIKASLKAFAQRTQDVKGQFSTAAIDIPATATTWTTFSYKNVSDSKMWGLEASASGKYDNGVHWSADTTYTDVKNEPFTTEAVLILRKVAFAQTTPKYRSNLAMGWANDKWAVDGFLHSVTKFDSYNGNLLEPVKGYTSLGGRIAYQAPYGIELALSGQNLLDARQSQAKGPSGLMAERRVLFTVGKSW